MEIRQLHIAFFSPTRSTRNCLKNIARGIAPTGSTHFHNLTLPAGREKLIEIPEDELLIIGMPVYGGRIPPLFERGLNIGGRGLAVCIVLYGNRDYDDALLELTTITRQSGFGVVGAAAFIAQHSLNTAMAQGRPDVEDIQKQIAFGKAIGQKVAAMASPGEPVPPMPIKGNPNYKPYNPAITAPALIARLCISCRICAGACPVQIIDNDSFEVNDPEKCIFCNACRVLCPRNARELPQPQKAAFEQRMSLLAESCVHRKEPDIII